jgi:hypothetical protein
MQRTIPSTHKGPWQPVARIAAILLLGLLGMDLADAACDPLPLPQGDRAHFAAAPEPQDACADFCVPDCFCCSAGIPAVPGISLPGAWAASGEPAERLENLIAGVSPVVDHIPITAL